MLYIQLYNKKLLKVGMGELTPAEYIKGQKKLHVINQPNINDQQEMLPIGLHILGN
jgi:hypothetical protein